MTRTVLIGNFCVYVCGHLAMMTVGNLVTDKLQDTCSSSPVVKEDSTVTTEEETLDTDTVATTAESLGSETLTKETLEDELCDTSICGCKTRWSMVVNGVQYFGCAKPKGSLSFGNADADEDTFLTHMESVKERNRRLLLQDRIVQAGRKKVRSAKRLGTFSSHPQKLQTVEEEKSLGERGDSPDDSFMDSNLVRYDQLREVEIMI